MSTTENAADPLTFAIEQLADIVSGNAAFQASVQNYSKDEARDHVHKLYNRPRDYVVEQPYAVIFELPGGGWERRADGVVMPRGDLFLHLGLLVESEEDPEAEERRFNNWHGQIAKDIAKYDGAGYRMTVTVTDPPSHPSPEKGEEVPVWEVGYTVAWSPFG